MGVFTGFDGHLSQANFVPGPAGEEKTKNEFFVIFSSETLRRNTLLTTYWRA